MKYLFFSPYALFSPESDPLLILARSLVEKKKDLLWLVCDGVFQRCSRKELCTDPAECFACELEAGKLVRWGSLKFVSLSDFITAEITCWLKKLSKIERQKAYEFFCRRKYQEAESDSVNYQQEDLLLGDYNADKDPLVELALLAASLGLKIGDSYPKLTLLTVNFDLLTTTFLSSFKYPKETAAFLSDLGYQVSVNNNKKVVKIVECCFNNSSISTGSSGALFTSWPSGEIYDSKLIIKDILSKRADHDRWPKEIRVLLDGIAEFVG
ncbi:MAG TPA: hypothetical protein PKD37_04720 [Oligoflexia bacterium]|nr:hypothetical protein [Oligoflexia bacterium]HMP27268.1 hypothetical protein [Oligoflexia bacterium]